MTPACRRAPRTGLLAALAASAAVVVAACGPGTDAGATPAAGVASPGAATPAASPGASASLESPIDGLLTGLESEGLTKVIGFRLRTDAGTEIPFRLGILENGAQFPPGHLAEHMATTTRVRVYFRDEGADHVVYRLEDAE